MSVKTPDCLVITGLPGAGKSTVGNKLAQQGWHHEDLDETGRAYDIELVLAKIELRRFDLVAARFPEIKDCTLDYFIEASIQAAAENPIFMAMARHAVFMLRRGIRTILDAPIDAAIDRQALLEAIKRESSQPKVDFPVSMVHMTTPLQICLERITRRNQQGRRIVPPAFVKDYAATFQDPTDQEGYAKIVKMSHRDDPLVVLSNSGIDVSATAIGIVQAARRELLAIGER